MRKILITLALLAGCATRQGAPAPLTPNATSAATFWCTADDRCFTDEPACRAWGDCSRLNEVWCAKKERGDFVCGTSRETCQEQVEQHHAAFGECVTQWGGK